MRYRLLVLSVVFTSVAASAADVALVSAASSSEAPLSVSGDATQLKVPWTEPGGLGFGIGYENGLFGSGFGQGIRFKIPFNRYFGLNLRALSVMGGGNEFVLNAGGRVELFGQTPVFLNVVRLYGGGGFQVFYPVTGSPAPALSYGGGGQFGFEFFMNKRASFFLEVGGNGSNRMVSGATVLAGINYYPF